MVLDNVAGNEAKRNEGGPQDSSMEGRDHLLEQPTGHAKIMTICVAPEGRMGSTLCRDCEGCVVPIGLALFFAKGGCDLCVGLPMTTAARATCRRAKLEVAVDGVVLHGMKWNTAPRQTK